MKKNILTLTIVSILLGMFFPNMCNQVSNFVAILFAFMCFEGSLGSSFKSIKNIIAKPKDFLILFILGFVIMPVITALVVKVLFTNDLATQLGIFLIFSIPFGIVGIMWVTLFDGNISLALALSLISGFLTPIIVPIYIRLAFAQQISLDFISITIKLLKMVVIPMFFSLLIKEKNSKIASLISSKIQGLSKVALLLIIANGATSLSRLLDGITCKDISIIIIVLLLTFLSFYLGYIVSKLRKQTIDNITTFSMTMGITNVSTAVLIANIYLPIDSMFPLVLCYLLQPLCANLFGKLIKNNT